MGDPHYRTFDGQYFNFMGNCTYIMAKNCHVDIKHPAFQVEARNENSDNSVVSSVGMVNITVYGNAITFVRNEFGYIRYDWQQYMVITVPDSFAGKVCGLCGNFNGKQKDDLTTPNGAEASSVVALGKSWRVRDAPGDATCQDQCSGQCEDCKSNLVNHVAGKVFCGLLSHIMSGPFKRCNAVIEPKFYKEICLYDFCMGKGVQKYLCDTLQIYTDACQRAGVKVYNWWTLAHCPTPRCPENSHYELCGSACPATCDDPSAPSKCTAGCVQTCTCNPGYIRSGNQCVLPSQCGCQYEGRYVQAGKSFWGDNSCSKRCQCSKSGGKRLLQLLSPQKDFPACT
ncbi:hypothetical protein Z043-102950 [Arapaima gigas]